MGAPATSVRTRPAPKRRARSARTSGRSPAARVATPSRRASPKRSPRTRSSAAPARRTAAKHSRITPPGGIAMLPVHAVGGAAGAVGGMADSGVVIGMTRGRIWIGVLGILLGGIVGLNVWGLSLSASTTGIAGKIDELERKNSVLEGTNAKRLSSDRIQRAAGRLGLITPTPKAISFVEVKENDAAKAAQRLAGGEISVLDGLVAPEFAELADAAAAPAAAAEPLPDAAAVVDAPIVEAGVPVAPEVTTPPAAAAPPAAAETVPAPTTAAPAGDGGGIAP